TSDNATRPHRRRRGDPFGVADAGAVPPRELARPPTQPWAAEHGDFLAQRDEVSTGWASIGLGHRRVGDVAQLGVLGAEAIVLRLELHHPADAFQVHTRRGQLADAAKAFDVDVAVPPVAALRSRRLYE